MAAHTQGSEGSLSNDESRDCTWEFLVPCRGQGIIFSSVFCFFLVSVFWFSVALSPCESCRHLQSQPEPILARSRKAAERRSAPNVITVDLEFTMLTPRRSQAFTACKCMRLGGQLITCAQIQTSDFSLKLLRNCERRRELGFLFAWWQVDTYRNCLFEINIYTHTKRSCVCGSRRAVIRI